MKNQKKYLNAINLNDFEGIAKNTDKEKIDICFNSQTTLSDKTRLVIIGTITPPKTAYFYCSFWNRIYGYIDAAANEKGILKKSLKDLKRGLSRVSTKNINIDLVSDDERIKKVNEIKNILSEYGIAFLDVMDRVIRDKINSYDDNIIYYVLARDKFNEIPKETTVIVNSKLALHCAKEISLRNFKYLSQRSGAKEEWVNAIKEAMPDK